MAKNLSREPDTDAPPIAPQGLPLAGTGRAPARKVAPSPLAVLVVTGGCSVIRRHDTSDAATDGRIVAPRIARRELRGGVDGVKLMKGGRYDIDGWRDNIDDRGMRLLSPEHAGYVESDGNGGWRHRWESVGVDGVLYVDDAGRRKYAATVERWLADGTIPRVTDAELHAARERTSSLINASSAPAIEPATGTIIQLAKSDAGAVASLRADLAAIDAEIARREGR